MKETKPKINTIVQDAYDEILWSSIKDNATEIGSMVGENEDSNTLAGDIFSSMYKMAPEIDQTAPDMQKQVMETIMNLPEYKTMREMTRLDEISSAFGTMKIAPEYIKQVEEAQKEQEKKEQQQQGKGKGKGQGDTPSDSQETQGTGTNNISDALASQIRRAARKVISEAQEKAEEWAEVMGGFGIGQGELQRLPFKQKMELAKTLTQSHKFKQISELAGRFRNIALSAAATTPSHGVDEIVDITQGDDIFRALPQELLKFKRTPALFMKDLAERKLLIYNLKGVENLGAGPIICCLDISGSMSGPREIWAKAVILALISLAEKQNRAFGVLTFSTRVEKSWFFPKDNRPTIQEKIEIASVNCDGSGTNFYRPLMAAFKMRKDEISKLNPADIVFITDGECRIEEEQMIEILKNKADTNMRIYSVGVSEDSLNMDSLEKVSDNISMVDTRNGDVDHVKGIMSKTAAPIFKIQSRRNACIKKLKAQ